MKINVDGTEQIVWIEKILEGVGFNVFASELKEPSKKDIESFYSKQCDHNNCQEQLVYDKQGLMFDLRYCAVCGAFLGPV